MIDYVQPMGKIFTFLDATSRKNSEHLLKLLWSNVLYDAQSQQVSCDMVN